MKDYEEESLKVQYDGKGKSEAFPKGTNSADKQAGEVGKKNQSQYDDVDKKSKQNSPG